MGFRWNGKEGHIESRMSIDDKTSIIIKKI